ncbi:MAG TPA: hypothetical protein VEO56_02470 [Bacteroidota bacterium]|nr:hypothetical protein [Bacteroidota bacterium]
MPQCKKCHGSLVEIKPGPSRRMFIVHCLRRGCRATTVHELAIASALGGTLEGLVRRPGGRRRSLLALLPGFGEDLD